jgi:predicted TIM-barrel fold metal-dependent hydrolase
MHCLDPDKFPYKASRTYTPQPAELENLIEACSTDNVVIVQATIENGPEGLVEALERCRVEWADKTARGIVLLNEDSRTPLHELSADTFAKLHALGVRSIRVHGAFGTAGSNAGWVIEQFRKAAGLIGVTEYGWSISAQLPLRTWAAVTDTLLKDSRLSTCTFVIDHNGSTTPEDTGTEALDTLIRLLRSRRAYIKIGALHRRSPEDISRMRPIVQTMATTAPYALLWGSDWPHCNSKATGPEPAPPLAGVDTMAELECLRSWLTDEQWMAMLVDNPARVFS